MRNPFLMFSKWIGNPMTVKTSKLSEVLTLKNHENHDFFKNTDFWLPNPLDNGSSRILGLLYRMTGCKQWAAIVTAVAVTCVLILLFDCHNVSNSFRKHQKWIPYQIWRLGTMSRWCRTSQLVRMVKYNVSGSVKIVPTFAWFCAV